MRLAKGAGLIEQHVNETLVNCGFPAQHWRRIRTNNPLERSIREIRRSTRIIGDIPNGESVFDARGRQAATFCYHHDGAHASI